MLHPTMRTFDCVQCPPQRPVVLVEKDGGRALGPGLGQHRGAAAAIGSASRPATHSRHDTARQPPSTSVCRIIAAAASPPWQWSSTHSSPRQRTTTSSPSGGPKCRTTIRSAGYSESDRPPAAWTNASMIARAPRPSTSSVLTAPRPWGVSSTTCGGRSVVMAASRRKRDSRRIDVSPFVSRCRREDLNLHSLDGN